MASKRLFFVGTAGSGKSTLTGTFGQWLKNESYDGVTVNLDPGADTLPYEADVDIRDWVRLSEIMSEYKLAPTAPRYWLPICLRSTSPKSSMS